MTRDEEMVSDRLIAAQAEIERLRDEVFRTGDALIGAEAEIERLKAVVTRLHAEKRDQKAEIERLRGECNVMDTAFKTLAHQLADVGRDNERLRAALHEIEVSPVGSLRLIARRALEQKP